MNQKFKHLLIVFGGLKGLEIALESDEKLSDVQDPADLFDLYLNTCPYQVKKWKHTAKQCRPVICNCRFVFSLNLLLSAK